MTDCKRNFWKPFGRVNYDHHDGYARKIRRGRATGRYLWTLSETLLNNSRRSFDTSNSNRVYRTYNRKHSPWQNTRTNLARNFFDKIRAKILYNERNRTDFGYVRAAGFILIIITRNSCTLPTICIFGPI